MCNELGGRDANGGMSIRAENGQKKCATLPIPLSYEVIQHLDHSSPW